MRLVATWAALACQPMTDRHSSAARSAPAQAAQLETARVPTTQARASAPGDRSNFTVIIDDARLLVIDPGGVRTGLDPASGKQVREIPNSSVFVDWSGGPVANESDRSFTVQVIVDQPPTATYRVVVVGLGRPSELAVHPFSSDGSAEPQLRVPLSLKEHSRTEFLLYFRSTPGDSSRLQKLEPGGPQ